MRSRDFFARAHSRLLHLSEGSVPSPADATTVDTDQNFGLRPYRKLERPGPAPHLCAAFWHISASFFETPKLHIRSASLAAG